MTFGDAVTFLVSSLLMLFVVAMVGIDQVTKLANLVLEVDSTDLSIVEVGTFCKDDQLACPAVEGVR